MAERRTAGAVTGRFSGSGGPGNIEELERNRPSLQDGLRIDRDDLDSCLIEQPDRYWRVAEAHAQARAAYDAAKMDLEDAQARQDKAIRADAEAAGEKITETRIQQEIKLDPKYRNARLELLRLSAQVDELQALKEAFQQRSFMLRELVALVIAERSDQGGAMGAYEARSRRAEAAAAARGEALKRERTGASGG